MVKFPAICASRRPSALVVVIAFLSGTTVPLDAFAVFPCGDLPSAPPPFASLWAAFRFWECGGNQKELHLAAEDQRRQLSPHSFSSSHCGQTAHCFLLGSTAHVHPLLCLLKYSGTPLQQLFPTLLCHQIFLKLALPPTGASFLSATLQQNSLRWLSASWRHSFSLPLSPSLGLL